MGVVFSMHYAVSVLEILFIDLLLSGDNAAVIAMICSHLPPKQRTFCVRLGVGIAVVVRILSLFVVDSLLSYPGLSAIGGLSLLAIGMSFSPFTSSLPEDTSLEKSDNKGGFFSAIRKIVFADFIMSIDNVIGVASIANGNRFLLIFGVVASIPIMLFFSNFFINLLNKYRFVFWIGVAFLGFIGGMLIAGDVFIKEFVSRYPPVKWAIPITCAILLTAARYLITILTRKEKNI